MGEPGLSLLMIVPRLLRRFTIFDPSARAVGHSVANIARQTSVGNPPPKTQRPAPGFHPVLMLAYATTGRPGGLASPRGLPSVCQPAAIPRLSDQTIRMAPYPVKRKRPA